MAGRQFADAPLLAELRAGAFPWSRFMDRRPGARHRRAHDERGVATTA